MMVKRVGALLVAIFLCMAMAILAGGLSGFVGGARWHDVPTTALIRSAQGSLNSITRAYVSVIINPAQTLVTLGFVVQAPAVEADSPVGAILLLGNHEIARWQQGDGAIYEEENYSLRGAVWVPDETPAPMFNLVLELGSKHANAFAALQQLRVQIIDPQGSPSLAHDFPIIVESAAPEITQAPPPPQAPHSTMPRTLPTTTTRAPITTAVPFTFALPPVRSSGELPTTTQQAITQPAQFVTVTTWHTVMIEHTAEPVPAAELPAPTQFTFAFDSQGGALSLPVAEQVDSPQLHVQGQAVAVPAAQNTTWLYIAGASMLLLAVGLVAYWLKTRQKTPQDKPAAQ